MRPLITFFLFALIAFPLFATTVAVEPSNPTPETPVTLVLREYVTCPSTPVATRNGFRIDVKFSPGICLTPPILATLRVPLGTLPPGDYEVFVNDAGGYGAFFVREFDSRFFITGQSVGPTTGGTEVTFYLGDTVLCFGPDPTICPLPQVTFNGVPATVNVEQFARGTLAVTTPPGVKGVADVAVTGVRGTRHAHQFRYYDPNEAPLPSMFERVLIPLWSFGQGAFGSRWSTDVTMFNGKVWTAEPYRRSPVAKVASRSTTSLDFGASRSGGALFFVPRDSDGPLFEFGSVIRDLSRSGEDIGTEIRVARETDFRSQPFSLLNVPVAPLYRVTIRIYDADSVEDFAHVQLYSMRTSQPIGDGEIVQLKSTNPCERFKPCASDAPAMAQIDLLSLFPEAAAQDRVRVEISPLANAGWYVEPHFWAFASITNNTTQHVTVITPQ